MPLSLCEVTPLASHLLHLCGRKHVGNFDAQFETLLAILGSGHLRLSECPVFWVQQVWVRLNEPHTVLNNRKHVLAARGTADDLSRTVKQREQCMVCFADLEWADIHAHAASFGSFGLAFTRAGRIGLRAVPVQYLDPDVDPLPDATDSTSWSLVQDVRNKSQGERRIVARPGETRVTFDLEDIECLVVPDAAWQARLDAEIGSNPTLSLLRGRIRALR